MLCRFHLNMWKNHLSYTFLSNLFFCVFVCVCVCVCFLSFKCWKHGIKNIKALLNLLSFCVFFCVCVCVCVFLSFKCWNLGIKNIKALLNLLSVSKKFTGGIKQIIYDFCKNNYNLKRLHHNNWNIQFWFSILHLRE